MELTDTWAQGDAREESYYDCLKNELLLPFGASFGKDNIHVTILPKKTEAGNPDFRVWDGDLQIVGYIEAKSLGTNLDQAEELEQLKRYRGTFPNLILTNFYEFRLYRDGAVIDTVQIAHLDITKKHKTVPPVENEDVFYSLLEKFFAFILPQLTTAEDLAVELAKRTQFLKEEVVDKELKEEKAGTGDIFGFYQAFKDYLIAGLKPEEFADLFSQTLTYGLFAARTRSTKKFNRKLAYEYIPTTIGILRDVFRFVSSADLPKPMEVILDDISEVLHVTDVKSILQEYYRDGKGEDPIVHFYETFLSKYDPDIREKRGVYYTPVPVVHYIVRSLHHLLKKRFGLEDGLASQEVTLLDPAGGTLTFPGEAIKLAVNEYSCKYGAGGKHNLIKNQILKNFYAFELMMAPYAIGHIKIGFVLEELGYLLEEDDRFRLYLTNTLDMEDLSQTEIPGLGSLSEESKQAGRVKKEQPILIILGNPPYSGISANINDWTEKLLKEDVDGTQSYYTVDGKPLGEKKLWLQDDYVKFLRFAQWKIHKNGTGAVGIITNHGYLDNPTFRGMRQSLMRTFNEIFILDLHGNSLKKETTPGGGKDENVFDIRQGVAIALFLKQKDQTGCRVVHADTWGLRKEKYDWLEANTMDTCPYESIEPQSPWYFFIPRRTEGIQNYLEWPSIKEVFPINNVGIVTARDIFAIDMDLNQLNNRIRQFHDLKVDSDLIRRGFKLKDTSTFILRKFRQQFAKTKNWQNIIEPITYRPFDNRYIAYSKWIVERPIYDTMRHMLAGENQGLTIGRQGHVVGKAAHWNLVYVTDRIIDFNLYYRGGAMLFPLYLYPNHDDPQVEIHTHTEKQPNIYPDVFEILERAYGKCPSTEAILYYVYAVLYSNTYREKYAEFLKIDFPRLPFTSDGPVFEQMSALGKVLADLHLLRSPELDRPVSKYEGEGENDAIEKPVYKEEEERVYINSDKYFMGVRPDVWIYHIGGYQVLHKYLKDRKGRQMDDPRHYCRVVTAIKLTIELQEEIDAMYPEVEKNIVEVLGFS